MWTPLLGEKDPKSFKTGGVLILSHPNSRKKASSEKPVGHQNSPRS